jgi:hypothetical protein
MNGQNNLPETNNLVCNCLDPNAINGDGPPGTYIVQRFPMTIAPEQPAFFGQLLTSIKKEMLRQKVLNRPAQ